MFIPRFGEDSHFDEYIFNWVVQPPPRQVVFEAHLETSDGMILSQRPWHQFPGRWRVEAMWDQKHVQRAFLGTVKPGVPLSFW